MDSFVAAVAKGRETKRHFQNYYIIVAKWVFFLVAAHEFFSPPRQESICRWKTTHSPERKERNTPKKPSAPFMSDRTSKGAFPPDLSVSDLLSKACQEPKQEGMGAVSSSVTRCPNNVPRCYQMFLKDLSDGPAPCQQLVLLQSKFSFLFLKGVEAAKISILPK